MSDTNEPQTISENLTKQTRDGMAGAETQLDGYAGVRVSGCLTCFVLHRTPFTPSNNGAFLNIHGLIKNLVVTVPAYLNFLQYQKTDEAGSMASYYVLRKTRAEMEKKMELTQVDITLDYQTDEVNIIKTKESEQENDVIYKSETDDVRADAAAAITITWRGTNAFDTYMNNAGNEWVPVRLESF